jgi:hypothetical protein
MKDLSPEARTIVAAGRNPVGFTRADRDRIKRGVMLRMATVGTATASTGTAAAKLVASKIAVLAVAALVVGGAAVSAWVLRRPAAVPRVVSVAASSSRNPTPAVPTPAATPEDVVTTPPALSADLRRPGGAKKTIERPNAASASAPAAADAVAGTSASAAPAPLDSELRVLRQAREELRAGHPENAYRHLVDFDRHHGSVVLAQERHALMAIALCRWRPGNEAQMRAQGFLRDAPESPLANRVRLACEKSNGVPK